MRQTKDQSGLATQLKFVRSRRAARRQSARGSSFASAERNTSALVDSNRTALSPSAPPIFRPSIGAGFGPAPAEKAIADNQAIMFLILYATSVRFDA